MQIQIFDFFSQQMKELEKNGTVTNLSCHPKLPGFYFNLGKVREINGLKLYEDCSKYRFKIIFYKGIPMVYPEPYVLTPGKNSHINRNLSLCLYHSSEFKWFDNPYLDKFIVPWTYMWQIYYTEWKLTGDWPGPEYPH